MIAMKKKQIAGMEKQGMNRHKEYQLRQDNNYL